MQHPNPFSKLRCLSTEVGREGVVKPNPVSVVDLEPPIGLDRGDEDDLYEVMDEDEDDEYGSDSVPFLQMSMKIAAPSETGDIHEERRFPTVGSRAQCAVCQRTQSGNVRLFRWPKDPKVRKKWSSFFGFIGDDGEATLDFENCFICSWHFDPDQFLYSDKKVFWAPGAQPRFKFRRTGFLDSFPWELTNGINCNSGMANDNKSGQRKRKKLPPASRIEIHFRQSKYRIVGKTKHPVAVITSQGNPNICYEFSYNRTSSIDGTKFYSCLTCRKAKSETRVKDIIRTIHLDGAKLLSRGDPFSGHHIACKPIFDTWNSDKEAKHGDRHERQDQIPAPLSLKPRTVHVSAARKETKNAQSVNNILPIGFIPIKREVLLESNGDDAWEERLLDDAGESAPEACIETEVNELGQSTCEVMDASTSTAGLSDNLSRRGKSTKWSSGSDQPIRLEHNRGVTTLQGLPKLRAISVTRPVHLSSRFKLRVRERCIVKRRFNSQLYGQLRPKCYICFRALEGARQLVNHLMAHITNAPQCLYCGEKCEAGADLNSRCARICSSCLKRSTIAQEVESSHQLMPCDRKTNDYWKPNGDVDEDGGQTSCPREKNETKLHSRDQLIVVD